MAWWKIGKGDDVSSDQVADVLHQGFDALIAAGAPKDDVSAMLRIWQDALNAEPRVLMDDAKVSAYRLRAEMTGTSEKKGAKRSDVVTAAETPSPVAQRTKALEVLRDVAGTYYDAKDRAPRINELAHSLAFAWGEAAGSADDSKVRVGKILIEPLK